jgi:hypothetical protein
MDTYTCCPTTAYNVQELVLRETSLTGDTTYEMVTCLVCNGVHLVDPTSGRATGADRPDHRTPHV